MPLATIHPMGDGSVYHIHFLDQRTDPGYGRPGGGHPDHDLPGRPPHVGGGPIFHPGHPDHGLPSQPGHPGNRPPGSGNPVFPDNSLPSYPPPHVPAGATLVLVRDQSGKSGTTPRCQPGSPPPRPRPVPPGVDNTLPTPPVTPGTPLPPTPAPKA